MSNPNFSHLNGLKIKSGVTAEYVFYGIEGEPRLTVKPAGETNARYLNAILKRGRRTLRRMRGGKIGTEVLRENRDQDRQLYPQHIVEGWDPETVRDFDGAPVPFSRGACEEFLRAVPDDMFDDLRAFCGDLDNFREEDDLTEDDVEEIEGK